MPVQAYGAREHFGFPRSSEIIPNPVLICIQGGKMASLLCFAVSMALPTLSYLKRPQEVNGKASCHVTVHNSRVLIEWRRTGKGCPFVSATACKKKENKDR